MRSTPGFRDYVLDLLEPLGGISARAMFGGYGIYRHGVIFALISKDTLYLKAGPGLRAECEARGFLQFTPRVRGQPFPMPYYEVSPDMMEDFDALHDWARRALAEAAAPGPGRSASKPGKRTPAAKRKRRRA